MDEQSQAEFDAGFQAGFQAVRGLRATVSSSPSFTGVKGNKTPYLWGIRLGVEKALGVRLENVDYNKAKRDSRQLPTLEEAGAMAAAQDALAEIAAGKFNRF